MSFKKRLEFEVWKVHNKKLIIKFDTQLKELEINGHHIKTPHHLTMLDWYSVHMAIETILDEKIQKLKDQEYSVLLESCILLNITTSPINSSLLNVMGISDRSNKFDFFLQVSVVRQKPRQIGMIDAKRTAATSYEITLNGYELATKKTEAGTQVNGGGSRNEEEYVPTGFADRQQTAQKYIPKPTTRAGTDVEPYQPKALDTSPVSTDKYVPGASTQQQSNSHEYTPTKMCTTSDNESSPKQSADNPVKINAARSQELFGDSNDEGLTAEDREYKRLVEKYKNYKLETNKKPKRNSKRPVVAPPKPSTSKDTGTGKQLTSWSKKGKGGRKPGEKKNPKKKETPEKLRRIREEAEMWRRKNAELKTLEAALPPPRKKKDYTNHEKKFLPEYTLEQLRDLYDTHMKEEATRQFKEYIKTRKTKPHLHIYDIQSLTTFDQLSLVLDLLQEKLGKVDDMGQHTVLFSEQLAPYVVMELYKLEFKLTDEQATEQAQWQAEPSIEDDDKFLSSCSESDSD